MSEMDSKYIQRKVHQRLHQQDGTQHDLMARCHSYALDDVVWETLVLLGEWDLLELDPKNEAARGRLKEAEGRGQAEG